MNSETLVTTFKESRLLIPILKYSFLYHQRVNHGTVDGAHFRLKIISRVCKQKKKKRGEGKKMKTIDKVFSSL